MGVHAYLVLDHLFYKAHITMNKRESQGVFGTKVLIPQNQFPFVTLQQGTSQLGRRRASCNTGSKSSIRLPEGPQPGSALLHFSGSRPDTSHHIIIGQEGFLPHLCLIIEGTKTLLWVMLSLTHQCGPGTEGLAGACGPGTEAPASACGPGTKGLAGACGPGTKAPASACNN